MCTLQIEADGIIFTVNCSEYLIKPDSVKSNKLKEYLG